MENGKIYLLPTTIGDLPTNNYVPEQVRTIAKNVRVFIVENLRTARRYLKLLDKSIVIDDLQLFEMDKHAHYGVNEKAFSVLKQGMDIAVMSEAGTPGIADPGANVVAWAHRNKVQVVPLVGPSSILLAMMASGMNGQNFAFVGYLPAKPKERALRLQELENISRRHKQSQAFIETPFRNQQLFSDILKSCNNATKICVAMNVNSSNEKILTLSVGEWKKKQNWIEHKVPAVFILHA